VRASIGITIGRCGFGCNGGDTPSVRLGGVHLWCCRGSVLDRLARTLRNLADAADELRRGK